MMDIQVDSLTFSFPDSWEVSKYDEWTFYRNQFSRMWSIADPLSVVECPHPQPLSQRGRGEQERA